MVVEEGTEGFLGEEEGGEDLGMGKGSVRLEQEFAFGGDGVPVVPEDRVDVVGVEDDGGSAYIGVGGIRKVGRSSASATRIDGMGEVGQEAREPEDEIGAGDRFGGLRPGLEA